jgi:predicted  nucleic acid-binding Zn-ribbon protein
MRIAIEHLWAQLTQKNNPRWLTKTLGQLRQRVGESLRDELQQIQQRRQELTQMAERIRGHQVRLMDQQARLNQWAKAREQELDRQAESLANWERELQRQRRELMRFRELWRTDQQRVPSRLDDWPAEAAAT